MIQCWKSTPIDRPRFDDVKKILSQMGFERGPHIL